MFIYWIPQAEQDFNEIYDYIHQISPIFAENFHDKIQLILNQIQQFPFSGRTAPEICHPTIREKIYQKYRIVYHILNEDQIEILAIFHG